MDKNPHSAYSSYREMVLEHVFLGELLRYLWQQGMYEVEVMKSQVDDSGYDLILECNRIVRHIQLKASFVGATTGRITANLKLRQKPSGCILWLVFQPHDLSFREFLWFGNQAGQPLPDISLFPIAKHTKANTAGEKSERPNIRIIEKRKFQRLETMEQVAKHLFGSVLPEPYAKP
jgi:hypothetical protein